MDQIGCGRKCISLLLQQQLLCGVKLCESLHVAHRGHTLLSHNDGVDLQVLYYCQDGFTEGQQHFEYPLCMKYKLLLDSLHYAGS